MAGTHESAMLVLQQGTGMGSRWPLDRSTLTIGREEDCDIVLADRHVSRHHARVTRDESGYTVEDLRSKNGTHVNGRELSGSQGLKDGDEIQIALRFKLAFVDAGATAPLTFPDVIDQGLRLHADTHQVYIHDSVLEPPLSPAQYRLLALLVEGEGRIVTRDAVVEGVWPDSLEEGVSEQAIDALVRRLRERLADVDSSHQYVTTVRGHGFRFSPKEPTQEQWQHRQPDER